jgi:hypothetical protein
MIKNKKKLKKARQLCQEAKIGEEISCPSCGTRFVKKSYQSVFCKSKKGTKCKDNFWNNVDESKRKNTTRISPASASWMARERKRYTSEGYEIINGVAYDEFGNKVYNVDEFNDDHPFSSEGLGQF